jgi:hypothetical protein
LLFVFLLALYLLTGGGKGYSVDGAFGYEMAKTVFLDPEHQYFKRFRTAFARWGALMPLLGQPFVLAGDALARIAPERDSLVIDGHAFRVEEWPALGRSAPNTYEPPSPPSGKTYSAIGIVSYLADSTKVTQGAVVGSVNLWEGERLLQLPIRAGVETAEWAMDRPDIAGKVAHRRPTIAGHWIGQPRGNHYFAYIPLPAPLNITRWELAGQSDGPAWHVGAVAFHDAQTGIWHDVHTGERYWSARQTRDFFTRLVYSMVNSLTAAGTAVLVYLLAGSFGYTLTTRVLVALGYGVATMAWVYAKLDFSEPATTFFIVLAAWALFKAFPPRPEVRTSRNSPLLFGLIASVSMFLAILGKYTAVLSAAALAVQWLLSSSWWRPESRQRAVTFISSLVIPAWLFGIVAVALALRFTGEIPILFRDVAGRLQEDWLALPVWIGLRGLLFSPGKSLFLYSPWLLLAIPGIVLFARRHGRHAFLVALFPMLVIWLYSMKLVWHGGGWGPRYLVPILPLLALSTAPVVEWCLDRAQSARLARVALASLAAVSIGVQCLGVAKDPDVYSAMVRESVIPALPEMGSQLGGRDYWLARGGDGLSRALLEPVNDGWRRGLGYVWGYPEAWLRIEFNETRTVDLSLYFVDWDQQSRRQSVTIEDARGYRTWELDRDFSGGLWATWQVTGGPEQPVRVALVQRGPDTAVLSAAAFDAPRRDRQLNPLLDESTQGNWIGRYGRDGYALFAWHSFNVDRASPPLYVARMEANNIGDKPDPRIHVEIAQQDVLDTPLLYATPFSPLLGNFWLLAADAARLVIPSRLDVLQAVLVRPPWTWFGVAAPRLEYPEYGLGLDFWVTLIYTNYASHRSVLLAMWLVAGGLSGALLVSGIGLWRAICPLTRRQQAVLALSGGVLLVMFHWLQVQT